MEASQSYIAVAVVALAIIALLVFVVKRNGQQRKLSRLAALAFAFVLAGILFGEDRPVGYGLMGIGVLLAVVDIIKKARRQEA
ncbi:Uncharacterised protein [Candidatus Burarchaeum australiense]|nr:Uncharacterised protein [Candidatus Burarchaeum australiense]